MYLPLKKHGSAAFLWSEVLIAQMWPKAPKNHFPPKWNTTNQE